MLANVKALCELHSYIIFVLAFIGRIDNDNYPYSKMLLFLDIIFIGTTKNK